MPFEILGWKSCPFYNFNTVKNIFMKVGTNITNTPDDVKDIFMKLGRKINY